MSSEEYYDTLVKITEAQIGVKDASVAVSKAQQENIIGYFGMALQVGNVASSLIMLNMHMKLLTGLTIGQTIATWAAAVAESAHAAAIWLKAHAMVVVMALTGVGLLVIAGLLAAAAAASASVSGIQAKAGRGMQMGGIIPETGWYYMHQYERVQRANASIGANITINVYGKDAKASAKTIGEELSTLRRRGVI
jgi:Zn-dependent alcohol dehydrogenase